ncbi:ATP-binding cassette domain-containing protein, partial [Escherichia coli]|nr:ATP-binding cassette domain-containing protein [Escherichia coli]
ILRGVDFSARQGEVTCLLGRNGVGKTTLLKCLMGLIPARSGEVRWQDQNITHRKPHQRVQAGVAYVPQGREIFPRLTVDENLLMGLSRFPAREAQQVPEEIYQLFPVLRTTKQRRGGDFSGGQQQRTAIARALVKGADLVLLDEPLANLDYKLREELRSELPRIFE